MVPFLVRIDTISFLGVYNFGEGHVASSMRGNIAINQGDRYIRFFEDDCLVLGNPKVVEWISDDILNVIIDWVDFNG